jgi:hypothetical protein
VLAVLALPCRAGQAGPPREAEAETETETLIRLRVTPAAAPQPALRYLLLPEHRELNPGNPCLGYLKCFMEQQRFFHDKEAVQRRAVLLAMPLKDLPVQELRDYGAVALSQADWAARLDSPDWQILLKLKTDGPGVLLPDLMPLQPLADALKVRFRVAVAQRRFDDAIRTAKTMFALARHLGEHPTLVGNSVGFGIARTALGPLEEMLEQPGCPNLYWALTNLPSPLVSLHAGMAGERDIFLGFFRDLDETAPMSADQLKDFIALMARLLAAGKPIKPGEGVRAWLDARTGDKERLGAARRRLVASGLPEERLLRFPPDQVILLDEKRAYEVGRDDILKLMNVPMWQALALALAARSDPSREPSLFAKPLLEGLESMHLGQARLDQRIALLRHVEALRLHAAAHHGKLPAALADITVPLPDDPFTGKPFRYDVDVKGVTAHLRGSPPPGEEKEAWFNVHYEVTVESD